MSLEHTTGLYIDEVALREIDRRFYPTINLGVSKDRLRKVYNTINRISLWVTLGSLALLLSDPRPIQYSNDLSIRPGGSQSKENDAPIERMLPENEQCKTPENAEVVLTPLCASPLFPTEIPIAPPMQSFERAANV